MKLRPMLQVSDVEGSSHWYQQMLGLRSGHGGDEFEMLFDGDELVLQLHRLDANEHGIPQTSGPLGNGVSLWFEVADESTLDAIVERAPAFGTTGVEARRWNPLAHHYEATLTDPDGYIVMVNTPFTPDTK